MSLKLSIQNCRAIHSAEIEVDGLTVISGVNSCGKSTIAKLFNQIISSNTQYEKNVADKFQGVTWFLYREIRQFFSRINLTTTEISQTMEEIETAFSTDFKQFCLLFIAFVTKYATYFSEDSNMKPEYIRAQHVLLRLFPKSDDHSFTESLCSYLRYAISETEEALKKQSFEYYNVSLAKDSESIVFYENNVPILTVTQSEGNVLGEIYTAKRSIYIESPFVSIPTHCTPTQLRINTDLEKVDGDITLEKEEIPNRGIIFDGKLFNTLNGGIEATQDQARWEYRRTDGKLFDLDECATGIKSLAILNILYKNGWLDQDTFLIIDEPEAHLHPQWVVEYAKILIYLVKVHNVRVLIASHSPEMVQALEQFSLDEKLESKTKFYLARETKDNTLTFDYENLGTDIAEIFRAFNLSYDKMSDYQRIKHDSPVFE